MKTPTEYIQALLKQIKLYNIQISTLTPLQDAATVRVSQNIKEMNLNHNYPQPDHQNRQAGNKNRHCIFGKTSAVADRGNTFPGALL